MTTLETRIQNDWTNDWTNDSDARKGIRCQDRNKMLGEERDAKIDKVRLKVISKVK